MEDKTLLQQLHYQAQVYSFFARFGFVLSRKAAETILARLWYADASRKRNAWPLKTDLLIGLLRTGISNVPPSIGLLQKYQPLDVPPVPPHKATVLECSLSVPSIPLHVLTSLEIESQFDLNNVTVTGEWIIPAALAENSSSSEQVLSKLLVSSCPVILYFHGGAYCFGSASGHRFVTVPLAVQSGALVLSLNYRLAPEHPFPAALQDTFGAYRWLAHKISPRRILLAGDSAGGGLTMATLLLLNRLRSICSNNSTNSIAVPLPAAGVCLSGWFDVHCRSHSWTKSWRTMDYLPDNDSVLLHQCATAYAGQHKEHPLVSSLLAPSHFFQNLPPILLQVGGSERILHDVEAMAEKLREAQVAVTVEVFPHEVHVFQAIPGSVHGKTALKSIATFIKSACITAHL